MFAGKTDDVQLISGVDYIDEFDLGDILVHNDGFYINEEVVHLEDKEVNLKNGSMEKEHESNNQSQEYADKEGEERVRRRSKGEEIVKGDGDLNDEILDELLTTDIDTEFDEEVIAWRQNLVNEIMRSKGTSDGDLNECANEQDGQMMEILSRVMIQIKTSVSQSLKMMKKKRWTVVMKLIS